MPITLFDDARFALPQKIADAKVLEDGRLLLSAGTRLFVLDPESGACVMEGSLEDEDVSLAVCGSSIVTYRPYAGPVRRLELGADGFEPPRELVTGEGEDTAVVTFADPERVVVVEETKVRVFGRDGTILDEIACPLEGAESMASARGRVAWQMRKRAAVVCVDVTTKKEVAIELPGDPTWGDMAFSPDGERLAIAFRQGHVLTIGIFDTATGTEILRIPLRPTQDDVLMAFAPDGRELFARLRGVLQCWSLSEAGATLRWTRPGVVRASDFLLPLHDRVGVAWGMRLTFVKRTTGEWLGDPLLPKRDIRSILRSEDGVVVMKTDSAAVLEDGRLQRGVEGVTSCLRSEGQIFLRTSDTLFRAGLCGEDPVAKLVTLSEGAPDEVRMDEGRLVYSGDGDEPVQVADRRGRNVRQVGTRAARTAWPLAGGRIAAHYVASDSETDRETHSIGMLDHAGETLWEKTIDGREVDVLATSRDALVLRADASAVVIDLTGEIVGKAEVGVIVDAMFHGADVVVLAESGALHRITGKSSSLIGEVGPGATAFSIDHQGKCLVGYGCRSVVEMDVGLAAIPTEAAPRRPILHHRFGHETEVSAFALSPDGKYLATGSFVGDDYTRGGTLQIWDATTGRVVNVLDPIEGGAGWPDHRHCIQWSPSGQTIAMAFDTNVVGIFSPFADVPVPRMSARTTDGWSRPPEFAWSNKEDRIAIHSHGAYSAIPICLADTGMQSIDEHSALWFTSVREGIKVERLGGLRFSAGDELVLGYDDQSIWAVDRAKGVLRYHTGELGIERAEWSPCGRWIAVASDSEVVFCDANTGEVKARVELESVSCLVWDRSGERLAAIGEAITLLYERKVVCTIETELEVDSDFDAPPLAWSPDGERVAWLADEQLHVSSFGEAPSELFTVELPEQTPKGLLWHAGDAIVLVGETVFAAASVTREELVFVRDLSVPTELVSSDIESPLMLDDEDLGAAFSVNPAFPIQKDDEWQWALAFDSGHVVCPPDLRDQLEDALSRTTDIVVHDDLVSALSHLPLAEEAKQRLALALAADESEDEVADVLPLGEDVPFSALSELHAASLPITNGSWDVHVSEACRMAAVIHARRGEAELAIENAKRAPQIEQRVIALAECASWIALVDATRAREVLVEITDLSREGMSDADEDDVPWWVLHLEADLGAAHALLGNAAEAETHFAAAERGFAEREEANAFENHTQLAAAYLRIKDVARAALALDRGPWSDGSASSLERYVAFALELGFTDHAFDIAKRLKENTDSSSMREISEALRPVLSAAGREKELDDLLREEVDSDDDEDTDDEEDSDDSDEEDDDEDSEPDLTAAFFEAERERVAKLRGNKRRFAVSSLIRQEIAAGQLAGAYASWRMLSKHHREFEVSELVRALSRAKEIGAAIHVLGQLAKKDDMNGLPTIAREAMQLAAGFGLRDSP